MVCDSAKKIPFEFRDKYPEIQWRGMTGLRDVLIHSYGFVDTKQVWHIVTSLVPQLHEQIGSVLMDLD